MTKKNIIITVSIAVTFVALMCIATFLDLKISLALGAKESVFGEFFDKVGEMPVYIGVAVASLIICQALRKTNKFYKWLKPLLLLLAYAGFFLLCWHFAEQFFAEIKWIYLYIAVMALVLSMAAILLTNRVDKDVMEKLLYFAAVVAIAVLIAQCVGLALNAIWTRQRFRNLYAGNYPGGSSEGFTPWYKPTVGKHDPTELFTDVDGKEDADAYNSFPNFSTLGMTAIYSIIVLPELFTKLRKYRIWFFILPVVLIAMTGIAGIIDRSAYLSDVIIAVTLGIGSVYIAKVIARLILKKNRIINSTLSQTTQEEEI